MSAVQDAIRQRQRGLRRLMRWPWAWPLLAMPMSLIVYVLAILAVDLALIGWELAETQWRPADLALAAALLVAAAICIEALRRLGQPSGVSRDLLSAWWLPIALLLSPLYALLAPFVVGLVLYARGHRTTPVYRRMFSSAALGLAGAATSVTFHRLWPAAGHVSLGGASGWLSHPGVVVAAIGCAVLFGVVNTSIVAIAAHLAEPEASLTGVLWDKESLLLDLTETCVGILVAITCALSPLLLLVALPPVILLQRSLMHQQLQAAARTDPKTGLLNAAAWQREADAEVNRALRSSGLGAASGSNSSVAMLLIDVDHFKRVNDRHGHLAGDEVLKSLAAELRQQVRDSDVVGRFGGEEFTVLLPRADAAEAVGIAERLRRSASMLSIFAGDARICVTVSIGVAVLGQHGRDLFELLAAADLALYRAKDKGRNQVCLYGGDEATGARP
ncbi:MAG: GGDEF domain-containing protein [Streptosporangiaceae bacterium]|nr:GGDEF domain-containing protein [Streptosporangiaceae bacterium]